MKLVFDNYRMVRADDLPSHVQRAIGSHEGARIEVVDILAGDQPRYRGYFFEGGSAAVLNLDGALMLRAVQHGVETTSDPELCAAVGAAYARAHPPIEQEISFDLPESGHSTTLGELHFDPDCDCWYADACGLRFWISGEGEPSGAQIEVAEAILADLDACTDAIAAVAPGAPLRELELWKPDRLIARVDGSPNAVEVPWPLRRQDDGD